MGAFQVTTYPDFNKPRDWSIEKEIDLLHKLIWLSSQGLVFYGSYNDDKKDWDNGVYPCLMCNDVFAPAADGESFGIEDVDLLVDLTVRFGVYGVMAWIGEKRGEKPWRPERWKQERFLNAIEYLRVLKSP